MNCCAPTSVTFAAATTGAVIHVRGKGGKERRVPIEPALVERLLNDVGHELDELPVLQHCLSRLWERAGAP